MNRTRELETEMMTSWRENCDGLEKDCSKHTETSQERNIMCKFKISFKFYVAMQFYNK